MIRFKSRDTQVITTFSYKKKFFYKNMLHYGATQGSIFCLPKGSFSW